MTAVPVIAAFLAPLLLGQDLTDVEQLTAAPPCGVAGNPFTKVALETAG